MSNHNGKYWHSTIAQTKCILSVSVDTTVDALEKCHAVHIYP